MVKGDMIKAGEFDKIKDMTAEVLLLLRRFVANHQWLLISKIHINPVFCLQDTGFCTYIMFFSELQIRKNIVNFFMGKYKGKSYMTFSKASEAASWCT